jgi:hypothetical protein
MAQSSNLSAFANNLNAQGSPVLPNVFETTTVSATAAASNVFFDVSTQSVLYYTTAASGNWTLNVRGNSTTTLGSIMAVGQTVTIAFLVTQGSAAFYQSGLQIDGVVVTAKWQGGTTPIGGNSNSVDAYIFSIVKTGTSSYTVFASQTKFA